MIDNPFLSICIPTYNRKNHLQALLNDIIGQLDQHNKDFFEIVISDNDSDDGTEMMVKELARVCKQIHYYKNGSNIGFDKNVLSVLDKAKGKFCWTLSDKRRLQNGALDYLFAQLGKEQNIYFAVIDISRPREWTKKFENGNERLEYGLLGGDLSTCIFRKDKIPTDADKYSGNFWIHFSIMMEMTANSQIQAIGNVFRLEDMDYKCYWANNGHAFITYMSLKNILCQSVRLGYDKSVINKVIRKMAQDLPLQVASARLHGLPITIKNFVILIREFWFYPFHLMIAILIFLSPIPVLIFAKKIKNFYAC